MSVITTSEFVVPSDPVSLKKIKDCCQEISASMTRTEGEKEFQKEAIAELAEATEIPKKFIRKLATLFHKSNRDAVEAEAESVTSLYDKVFDLNQE